VEACFRRGLLILGAGRNALRLCPPLVLTRAQAEIAIGILDDALGSVRGS
jgi:4-aminobutyrate aminotransferase